MKRKAARQDFTEESLPKTRKAAFFDRLKNHYGRFVEIGLLLFAFLLPLFGIGLFENLMLLGIQGNLASGAFDKTAAESMTSSVKNFASLLRILGFGIAGVGVAGLLPLLVELVYDEPLFFWHDFAAGIKKNWLRYFLLFLFAGAIRYLCLVSDYFGFYPAFVVGMMAGVSLLLFLPAWQHTLSLEAIYETKFWRSVKNGYLLYGVSVGKSLLSSLLLISPLALLFIPWFFVSWTLLTLAVVFLCPLLIAASLSINISTYDEFINKNDYPDLYHKGLAEGEREP